MDGKHAIYTLPGGTILRKGDRVLRLAAIRQLGNNMAGSDPDYPIYLPFRGSV